MKEETTRGWQRRISTRRSESRLSEGMQALFPPSVRSSPADFVDDYRERLTDIVEKRLAAKQGMIHETSDHEEKFEHATTNVVDFMSLLEKSLETGKRSAKSADKATPAKKSSAASSPSKKAGVAARKRVAKPRPASKRGGASH